MQLNLNPTLRKLIHKCMRKGGYATPEDAIHAALRAFDQNLSFGDFDQKQLNALLAEGETSLREEGPMTEHAVYEELKRRSRQRRKPKR